MKMYRTLIRVEKAIKIDEDKYTLDFVLPGWNHNVVLSKDFIINSIDIADKVNNITKDNFFRGFVDVNLDVENQNDLNIENLREVDF